MNESLISVIPGHTTKQTDIGDKRACVLFKFLWNRIHSNYPVKIVNNPHDFGSYPDIQIREDLFNAGINDYQEFPNGGIESHSSNLCDIWNRLVIQNRINNNVWQLICNKTGLQDNLPFTMEY